MVQVFDLSLLDLITPYVLRGDTFGDWHAALSILLVRSYTIAIDDTGIVIRGIVSFEGKIDPPVIDPTSMTISMSGSNTEGHPQNQAGRRDPWIDIRDSNIEFQLVAPRVGSQKVVDGVAQVGINALGATGNVLNAYDAMPLDDPSDFPSTEFTLDFVLTALVLRPPFLRGAKREANGQLVPDPSNAEVEFTLPKIKMRLTQGSGTNDPLQAELLSLGASGLDDPGDLAVAELITMSPPYAFIGSTNSVGFGFRSGILDLSDNSTPPAVLEKFGFDPSWTGLYLPEITLFVAPEGAQDLAVSASAYDLLIGFGQSSGITGDFEAIMLNQGDGGLELSARFYDASGRGYGITKLNDTSATVQLPERTRMIVDVEGGMVPYSVSAAFDNGAATSGREFDVTFGNNQTSRKVVITAGDSSNPNKNKSLSVDLNLRPKVDTANQNSAGLPTSAPNAKLTTTNVTQDGVALQKPRLKMIADTGSTVTLVVDTDAATQTQTEWTVNGVVVGTSASRQIDLLPGQNTSIRAKIPGAQNVTKFEGFFRFDHPKAHNFNTKDFAQDSNNTSTSPAADEGVNSPWLPGTHVKPALYGILKSLPASTEINVKGYASFEQDGRPSKRQYNAALAERRAQVLHEIITDLIVSDASLANKNLDVKAPVADMDNWTSQGEPDVSTRRIWWMARATWANANTGDITIEGEVTRPPVETPQTPQTPIPVIDPQPANPAPPPTWFHYLGARVRIIRNTFVACEVFGKFDIQTAAENRLQGQGTLTPNQPIGASNPADGLIDVRVVIQIDDATDLVSIIGYFGADPADTDGLYLWGALPNGTPTSHSFGRDFLGTTILLMPLLSATAGAVDNQGALVQLGVTGALLTIPTALAGSQIVKVERIIWYGGEIATRIRPTGTEVTLLLDVETAISMDFLGLIKISEDAPLVVRYKAVGLLLGNEPGNPRFQFRPMFDASKGYTIDLSRPGTVKVRDPLGDILKVLGARISRNNPFFIEVDLGFAVDTGVVTVEQTKLRVEVENNTITPSIGALGAAVDIPATLKGRGYVQLPQSGDDFKGQFDLTLVPIGLRIAAGLGIGHIKESDGGPASAVIVTLEVEFPVAIPLGTSGLGIYGLLGLFAVNYARDESTVSNANLAPALAWLRATNGNPADIKFWSPKIDTWAFGVGAIVGTMGSSTLFNLKGVVLLELPGPRLLLMMKANILKPMLAVDDTAEGLFLAVIDLDLGRRTLTIGLSAEYKVDPLIRIFVPAESFFDFDDSKNWYVNLGSYQAPAHANILGIFDGTGYLMISGNGLQNGSLQAQGLAVGMGLKVSILWGSKSVGLYVSGAAGFDAIIGFDPFTVAGTMYLNGGLRLFIVTIGVSANLSVFIGENTNGEKISYIKGEVKGRVEFLFFEVSGSVSFTIGSEEASQTPIPALVGKLTLVSRSPALAIGTGGDKPIDASIGDAAELPIDPDETVPVVPIDAIPVLMMSLPPVADTNLQFEGTSIPNPPDLPQGGWVQRGDNLYRYVLKTITLSESVLSGDTPATWWIKKHSGDAVNAQLALLSWLPEPVPKAVERSEHLESTVKDTWGTICQEVAPVASVFWTFLEEPLGPSKFGWVLDGEIWPDPPDTYRSKFPNTKLRVTERWRSGNMYVDTLAGVIPAEVQGAGVPCGDAPANDEGNDEPTLVPGILHENHFVDEAVPTHSTVSEIINGLNNNETISYSEFANLGRFAPIASDPIDVPNDELCLSRVLASPVYAWQNPNPPGGIAQLEALFKARNHIGFKMGPFDEAVIFHTGSVAFATFLLFAPAAFVENRFIVVAVCDKNENVLHKHLVGPADVVPLGMLPDMWIDPAGPWNNEGQLLIQHHNFFLGLKYQGVVVTIEGVPDGDHIQIGIDAEALEESGAELIDIYRRLQHRPYYVAAIETLESNEVERVDWDKTQQDDKVTVIGDIFAGSTDHALLKPNTNYDVTTIWSVERKKASDPGGAADSLNDQSQIFRFRTDSEAPQRLDPWILATTPDDGETHFFSKAEKRIVFSTINVVSLYDAYEKNLELSIRAASFRPVKSSTGAAQPATITNGELLPIAAAVLSPWEAEMELLLEDSCVPINQERTRHSEYRIDMLLETFTDYILVIESVDKNAPAGTGRQVILQRSFSTGAFETLADFALSFMLDRVQHRAASAGKLQAIGTKFTSTHPEGNELDTEFIDAGIEPLGVPEYPRIIVFWESSGNTPSPAAILVDASEPMWRRRNIPKEITDNNPQQSKRYVMLKELWLELVEKTEDGVAPVVAQIVPAPGGARALITLKPNSRGKQVRLALRKIAQPEPHLDGNGATDDFHIILDLTLDKAPWEEED